MAGSKDKKKPSEKKGGEKGKGKAEETADKGGKVRTYIPYYFGLLWVYREGPWKGKGGLKAATAVNVRHILCEKHSKATEALGRIQVRICIFRDAVLFLL
jgi:NIMA-interacting peptidyl-prolyl cis-trans isomerase 4